MQTDDPAARAEFVQFDPVRVVAPVFLGDVIALFTLGARQRDVRANGFLCHFNYP
jgi:hypothetical protein